MNEIKKTEIVGVSCKTMFDVVYDIEKYNEFISWCKSAKYLTKDMDNNTENSSVMFEVDLGMVGCHGMKVESEVVLNKTIKTKLVNGPLETLNTEWIFKEIDEDQCEFCIKIEFLAKSGFMKKSIEKMFSSMYEKLIATLVDRAVGLK